MRKLILFAVILLFVWNMDAENLIKNGNFENADLKDLSIGPRGLFRLDSENIFSGKQSLAFKSVDAENRCSYNTPHIAVTPGQKYRFSGHYLLKDTKKDSCRISGRIVSLKSDKNEKPEYVFPELPVVLDKWSKFKWEFYPASGSSSIYLTLWFTGKGSFYLDDLALEPIPQKTVADQSGSLVSISNGMTIWKASPNLKVNRNIIPDKMKSTDIRVSCAKNESEPFQLIINPEKDFPKTSLVLSDLRNKNGAVISSENISFRPVGFIEIKKSSIPTLVGQNADPFLHEKIIDCKAGKNQPFWITVSVPESASPGIYSGTIVVISELKELISVNYEVEVWNFPIPDTPFLRTAFYTGNFPHMMGQWDKRPSDITGKDAYNQLKAHRITANQAIATPLPVWEVKEGKLIIKDWKKFDEAVGKNISEYGMRWFRVKDMGFFGDAYKNYNSRIFNTKLDSPDGLDLMTQYARALALHLKEKGWLQYMNSYIWDEPCKPEIYALINRISSAIKTGSPDLNIFVSSGKIIPDLKNINTWALLFEPGFYDAESKRKAISNGQTIWYYNWLAHLDNENYIRNRIYPWLTYLEDGEGCLLFGTLFTVKDVNPWTEINKTYQNGAATLMYPPRKEGEGYYNSQRFALMKESIDDFDYMKILENKIDKEYPGLGKARVKEILRELVYNSPFEYHNNPTLLYSLREKLAKEIIDFDKQPKAFVSTVPADNSETLYNKVEIHVKCPASAKVKITGYPESVPEAQDITYELFLDSPGCNIINIDVSDGKSVKKFTRKFILKEDPNLLELKKLANQSADAEMLAEEMSKKKIYTPKDAQEVVAALKTVKASLIKNELSRKTTASNPLYKVLLDRAQWAYDNSLFKRANYYLKVMEKIDSEIIPDNWPVKIKAIRIGGHQAYQLSNSKLEVIILESGARIYDFKVNGASCLTQGDLTKDYPETTRAEGMAQYADSHEVPCLGGYEDADLEKRTYSNADWDIYFPVLSPEKITVAAEYTFFNRNFRIRREMTLGKNSSYLCIKYTIKNITAKEFATDDPFQNGFNWRGWSLPGIGGVENDILIIPSEEYPSGIQFETNSGQSFSRSIKLNENFAGVFDSKTGVAFAYVLDPQIKYAYIWVDSLKSNSYTIEPHKSILGGTEQPFFIKAGESVTFTNYMCGFNDIKSVKEFKKAINMLEIK